MYEIRCTIEPIVPVMLNKFPMPKKPGEPPNKYKGEDEEMEALEEMVWRDEKGLFIPADNFRMMLIGNQFRDGAAKILGSRIERAKGTAYTEFCKACVWVTGEEDPLKIYPEPKRDIWDDVDIRSYCKKQGRDYIRRPLLCPPLTFTFKITVTDETMAAGKIKQLYEVAGMRCGIGAYGPTFGRFIIKKWEVVGKKKKKAS